MAIVKTGSDGKTVTLAEFPKYGAAIVEVEARAIRMVARCRQLAPDGVTLVDVGGIMLATTKEALSLVTRGLAELDQSTEKAAAPAKKKVLVIEGDLGRLGTRQRKKK